MTPLENEVAAALDRRRDETVELLREMVRTVSINPRFDPSSPGEAAMAALVQREYRALRIPFDSVEVEPGRPNTLARWRGSGDGPTLLVNCHVDTVPPRDADVWFDPVREEWLSEWSADPFAAEVRDGWLWGRGAADHKLPIAATIAALRAFRDAGVRLRGHLSIVHDADEETGGAAGMRALAQRRLIEADRALYACTTSFTAGALSFFSALGRDNLIRALQGTQRYTIRVTGRTYHALTPKYGSNAAENGAEVIEALRAFIAEVNAATDGLTGTGQPMMRIVGIASSGPSESRPANRVEIRVVRRLAPGTDGHAAFAALAGAMAKVARPAEGFEIACEKTADLPANEVAEGDPVVAAFASAAADVRGPLKVTGLPASVGISQFLAAYPVPTIMFGYGILNFHHAFDERVAIQDVLDTAKAYALGFMRYLGAEGGA